MATVALQQKCPCIRIYQMNVPRVTRYARVSFDGGRNNDTGEASSGWVLEVAEAKLAQDDAPAWNKVAEVGIFIGRRTVQEAEHCAACEAIKALRAWLTGSLEAELLHSGCFR